MPNLHCHAFQRAMAGLTERFGPTGDSFWHWREVMYRFLAVLTPDDVQAIAAQLYVECLLHGYTSVAEFHYLHNAPDGSRYADPMEMSHRIVAAAHDASISLMLLPVLYRHPQFGGAAPTEGQRRFILSLQDYADLCSTVAQGVAPHSLRAVTPEELNAVIAIASARPIHIHVAEQEKEVADCIAWSGGGLLPGCSIMHRSMRAGAWCTRRTSMQRNAGTWQRAARSSVYARRRKPTSATASFRCVNSWPTAAASASAAIRT